MSGKNVIRFLIFLLLYLAVIFIFFPGLFLDFSNKIPFANHGDVRNILGIIGFSIQVPLNQIYHLPIFYPESFALARTHPLFGVSVFFKLFQFMGLNLPQSYNLYIILSLLIGAWGCYLLAREFSRSSWLAFAFSLLYIGHRWNFFQLFWMNFFSRLYIPFAILFLIRFFKNKKWSHLILAGIFSFYQFFTSIYYGVYLWLILIPMLLLFALILRAIAVKDLVKTALVFGLLLMLLIWIFYPYTSVSKAAKTDKDPGASITAADLFSYSGVLSIFLDYPEKPALALFPGFIFLLFPIFFLISGIENQRIRILIFAGSSILIFVFGLLAFLNQTILNLLFPVFLVVMGLLIIKKWSKTTKWEKLILLVFSGFLVLFLRLEGIPLLGRFSLLELVIQLVPVRGLVQICRIFLMILPLFIVLATIGGEKLVTYLKMRKKCRPQFVVICIIVFLIMDNVPFPAPFMQDYMMRPLPEGNVDAYDKIPFKKNLVLLEIPFYFRMITRNSLYLLNWRFHQNTSINGKTSLIPSGYIRRLQKIVGRRQKRFPNEQALKQLLEQYSLNYIIFHWNLLSRYHKNPKAREEIMPLIQSISQFGRVEYQNDRFTVMKVREYIPSNRIIRHFSQYHLKRNRVGLWLEEFYAGRLEIYFNNRLFQDRIVKTDFIEMDFKKQPLRIEGNKIELKFQRMVRLKELVLVSEAGSD